MLLFAVCFECYANAASHAPCQPAVTSTAFSSYAGKETGVYDMLLLDVGCKYYAYNSNFTRSMLVFNYKVIQLLCMCRQGDRKQ